MNGVQLTGYRCALAGKRLAACVASLSGRSVARELDTIIHQRGVQA